MFWQTIWQCYVFQLHAVAFSSMKNSHQSFELRTVRVSILVLHLYARPIIRSKDVGEGSGQQTYFALDYNTNVKKSGGHTQNCIPCWYEFVYPECRKPRPRECVEICSYTYTLKIVFDPGIFSQTSKPNADFMQILFLPVITGINKEWPMHVRPLGITV
jgi:hypothetical protein